VVGLGCGGQAKVVPPDLSGAEGEEGAALGCIGLAVRRGVVGAERFGAWGSSSG